VRQQRRSSSLGAADVRLMQRCTHCGANLVSFDIIIWAAFCAKACLAVYKTGCAEGWMPACANWWSNLAEPAG